MLVASDFQLPCEAWYNRILIFLIGNDTFTPFKFHVLFSLSATRSSKLNANVIGEKMIELLLISV